MAVADWRSRRSLGCKLGQMLLLQEVEVVIRRDDCHQRARAYSKTKAIVMMCSGGSDLYGVGRRLALGTIEGQLGHPRSILDKSKELMLTCDVLWWCGFEQMLFCHWF